MDFQTIGGRKPYRFMQCSIVIFDCLMQQSLEKVLIENFHAKPISDANNVTYASDFSLCTYEIDNRTRLNAEKK